MKISPLFLLPVISLLFAWPGRAAEVGGVDVHGSVSLTGSYSDTYNYYGETNGQIDLNIAEVTVNGQYRWDSGLRLAAQVYGYQLDDFSEIVLDYGLLEYPVATWLGLRAGRVKWPLGLYNEVQDVDMVRPFVFLPQAMYPKNLRALTNAIDGGQIFGSLEMGRVGSLDYKFVYGTSPKIDADIPYMDVVAKGSPSTTTELKPDINWSAWLFWNTPLEGLRLGATYSEYNDAVFQSVLDPAAQVRTKASFSRNLPSMVDGFVFPGAWDKLLAGKPLPGGFSMDMTIVSAEYQWEKWTFAAEFMRVESHIVIDATGLGPQFGPLFSMSETSATETWYGLASYRVLPKVEVGFYHTEYYNPDDRDGSARQASTQAPGMLFVPGHTGYQKENALAVCWYVTDYWLIKAEVRFIQGTSDVLNIDNWNGDPARWDENWTYGAIKTTFSF